MPGPVPGAFHVLTRVLLVTNEAGTQMRTLKSTRENQQIGPKIGKSKKVTQFAYYSEIWK